jgi:murein tripeptide amidase MpaA
LQGAIDFLVSDAPLAQRLRRCFVFKVVPMLNPDGVVAGNYRSSLAGAGSSRRALLAMDV